MVDIYIYTEVNMLLQFNDRHMHSLRKVATIYRQEGRAWEQGKGCEGCLVEEDCLFRADKPKFCWTQTIETLLCKEQV